MSKNFVLHTSKVNAEGCPVDKTSPVPPPWEMNPVQEAGGAPQPEIAPGKWGEVAGMLAKWGRNPEVRPYEDMFRSEPNDAWFDVSRDPDHPTQFEILSIRPPRGQSFIVFDYSVVPYGFSGVTPLDYEALEDNEISGSFGYSLTMNGQSPGPLTYRLQALDSTLRTQASQANQSALKPLTQMSAADFAITASKQYAGPAGYGTALHPQTAHRYGARQAPFMEFVHDEVVLTIVGVVFQPIARPLAFIQGTVAGYQCTAVLAKQLERELRDILR
jgi:hypothetical protein